MSHYSDDPAMVRVDFFKADDNGRPRKYGTTEAIKWIGYDDPLIQGAFLKSVVAHVGNSNRLAGMVAVCLNPYHAHSFPLILIVPFLELP